MFRAREATHFLAMGILGPLQRAVSYIRTDEKHTGVCDYAKLIFAEYDGNEAWKNVPFIFRRFS